MDGLGEVEKGLPLSQRVAIEQDIRVIRGGRPESPVRVHRRGRSAADQRMLPPFAIAGVVIERTVASRHAGIVLANAPAHLRDECLAQGGGGSEDRLRECVFRLQMSADVPRQSRWICQDFTPVVGFQPSVVVAECHAMDHGLMGGGESDGRLGGGLAVFHISLLGAAAVAPLPISRADDAILLEHGVETCEAVFAGPDRVPRGAGVERCKAI
ncbi:hypothetical protein CHELA1G11_13187 [Hyphomicrobiales bacterium]|nr:hypothetical protein CHELA1G11_13187 [Hyphomicrobiales bacterium]